MDVTDGALISKSIASTAQLGKKKDYFCIKFGAV